MDIASLSSQQVYTLYGIVAFLTFATLTLGTAAIVGTIQRISVAKGQPTPPTAERAISPARTLVDEVAVAA